MLKRLGLALLVLAVPDALRADDAVETLLPASTQVYLRWDGIDAHRAAYEKTPLGKTLQGDTGKLLQGLYAELNTNLGTLLTVPLLLEGTPPERLQRIQADAKVAPKLLETIVQNGLVLGIDVRSGPIYPEVQATLILPQAGAQPEPFLSVLRLLATQARLEVKELKVANRTVFHMQVAPVVHIAWWIEGKHAVVVAGTGQPEAVVQRLHEAAPGLSQQAQFKHVREFKEFETALRGFVDLAALVKQLRQALPKEAARLMDDLGLDGLQRLTFYSGFDGDAERSVLELNVSQPRKGLTRLAGGLPFKRGEIPPLPADVLSFTMTKLDLGTLHDVGLEAAEKILAVAAPQQAAELKKRVQQTDAALGINLRNDLLAALGDKVVVYQSPSEGILLFGQTILLEVRDAPKLQAALEKSIQGLGKLSETNLSIQKKDYHGARLHEVHIRQQGFLFLPTYTIHKGWLAVSLYPQATQGYVLRANGELPPWQPDARVRAALEKMPAELLAVSVSDPRPTVRQALTLAPLVAVGINGTSSNYKFDVGALPNAAEATRHLFPNVWTASGGDTRLRLESRTSLALPLEISGLDLYSFIIAVSILRF